MSAKSSRTVLFLAYHFPPIGGGGVGRSAKLVRYLPESGYRSVVVCGPAAPAGRWTPLDEELASRIPAQTEVISLPGPAPEPYSRGWKGRIERWLGGQTRFSRWWIEGAQAVGRTARDVDVVYASMAPYESADVAAAIKRELGKPWVADLRDPWALDEMTVYPTRLHRERERKRMRRLLATADAVVTSTPEAERRVREAFPEFDERLVVTIPNGFDRADFDSALPERTDSAFRIVHTGYLHSELGFQHRKMAHARELLGGAVKGLDILTRSHVYLLAAIDQLIKQDRRLAETIEVHLAGVLSETDKRIAARSPVVRLLGYVPHRQTVELLRSADLLFLPMHDLPPGTRAGIVPGKTYEYIESGRPILAAVPDGDARDMLEEAGTAHLCRPADVDAMVRIIRSEIERWRAGEEPPAPDPAVLERFNYRNLARQLAEVFDEVIAAPRAP
jgi:glycosyltransferase involved in cell wall biosynthesis